jgi:hypothetical protein
MFSVIDATLGGDLAKQSQRKRIYEERAFDPEIGEMHPRAVYNQGGNSKTNSGWDIP